MVASPSRPFEVPFATSAPSETMRHGNVIRRGSIGTGAVVLAGSGSFSWSPIITSWIHLMDFDGTNVTKTYKNCVLFLAARNHRSQLQGSLHGAWPQRCGFGPLPARISAAESIQRSRAPLGNQFVLPKYAQKKVQMENYVFPICVFV